MQGFPNSKSFEFEKRGHLWLRSALSDSQLAPFDVIADQNHRAGQRLPAKGAELRKVLAPDAPLQQLINKIDTQAQPVRAVVFNKIEGANWGVPWHQDRVICVDQRQDVPGFTNWTEKAGVVHCEPPVELLRQMLFVRVHLDDADDQNGAMQTAIGSHALGLVPSEKAEAAASSFPIDSGDAQRGDVLIMNMLTLHASKPAVRQSSRRVFRFDYAGFDLPAPLRWATS
ncbi:phytanoyl-CoA dioxygenase family protein [Aliiroseovarius marinus]|uniref:phytanoyl-CoA dioxygenase family protein n=1 Tax=Aliiroseovarius marinus TaxID=2500159 RepID=UPI003D7E9F70